MGIDIHCFCEKKIDGKWIKINLDNIITFRNYNIFALMANVRNGVVFAGIKTGEPIEPISKPKGLPIDLSNDIKNESMKWSQDGHSRSWLTAKEINDYYKKHQKSFQKKCGYVPLESYNGKPPKRWAGDVHGDNIIKIKENEIQKYKDKNPKLIYVFQEWEVPLLEYTKELFDDCLSDMIKSSDGKLDDIRLVFWFDS